jgi:hypothetical protein
VNFTPQNNRLAPPVKNHPLLQAPEGDLDFILQFVLASGSLKEMARIHGVSYPTIRATLDRVIASLQTHLDGQTPDPMIDFLADLVERGEIKMTAATSIRSLYRQAIERQALERTLQKENPK